MLKAGERLAKSVNQSDAILIYKFLNYLSKIYNYAIALTRKESGSVAMGFAFALINYMFSFVMIMSIMILLRGGFNLRIRGEFGLYVLTGVALYQLHNKIIQELSKPSQDKSMIPLLAISPGIMIFGAILHTVYMQVVIVLLFLAGMWVFYGGFVIEYPVYAIWIFFLCAAWSVAMGMCLYSIVPVWPAVFQKIVMLYRRIGVVTSGKMIPGNMLQGRFHGLFAWNPLYHCIDQLRGAVFVNYQPFNSSLSYAIWATIYISSLAVLLYVGLRRFR